MHATEIYFPGIRRMSTLVSLTYMKLQSLKELDNVTHRYDIVYLYFCDVTHRIRNDIYDVTP